MIFWGLSSKVYCQIKKNEHTTTRVNEAGKSTLRRALINLFFGIPVRTSDAHLHPNNQLRIGANIINDDLDQLLFYPVK